MESSADLFFQAITLSGKHHEKWINMLKVKKIRKEQVICELDLFKKRQARKNDLYSFGDHIVFTCSTPLLTQTMLDSFKVCLFYL